MLYIHELKEEEEMVAKIRVHELGVLIRGVEIKFISSFVSKPLYYFRNLCQTNLNIR